MVTADEVKNFEKNITLIRRTAGWSAEEFGKRVGMSRQSINNIETGKYHLTKPHYVAMRYALNEEIKEHSDDTKMLAIVLDAFVDRPNAYSDKVKDEIEQKAKLLSPAIETTVATRKEVSKTWQDILTVLAATAIATSLASLVVGIWKNNK